MVVAPQPRFTDPEVLGYYLRSSGTSVPDEIVRAHQLVGAENMVERYTRRRFTPDPPLRTDYQRQVVSVAGQGQTNVLQLAGSFTLSYLGEGPIMCVLPVSAVQLQAGLRALPGLGAVECAGGPLPSYPISVYMKGVPNPTTTPQAMLVADSTGLGLAGYAAVTDAGFDSNPPVVKKYTTRGKSEIRVPDLRVVDAGPDPRMPGSGGVVLYGRRLLPNQYFMGYNAYAEGGADEPFGTGDYAEPATHLTLGYGYGLGMTLAQQFAFVLPQMYLANDLWITGRWGWNPTPVDILDGTYSVAARRFKERDAAFADTLQTPEGVVLAFFKSLPASIKAIFDSYRVPHIALVGV